MTSMSSALSTIEFWNCLPHARMRDTSDDVVQAFDMLDIDRRVDVDPGGEQLFDIEITLGVTALRRVRVGELIDQDETRPPRQDGVDVHLRQDAALVDDVPPRDDLKAGKEFLGLLAAMGLDDAHHHVHALAVLGLGGEQHFIRFADARRGAQEDFQPPPVAIFGFAKQGLGRGPFVTRRYVHSRRLYLIKRRLRTFSACRGRGSTAEH